jgi:hypothetical protein
MYASYASRAGSHGYNLQYCCLTQHKLLVKQVSTAGMREEMLKNSVLRRLFRPDNETATEKMSRRGLILLRI